MSTKPSDPPFYYATVITSVDGATATFNHKTHRSEINLFKDWRECLRVNTEFLPSDTFKLESLYLVRVFDPDIKQLANGACVVSSELLLSSYREWAIKLTEEMEKFLNSCLHPENVEVTKPLHVKSLKQGNVYFDESDDILNTISKDGLVVECPIARHLIKELDRRLLKLCDKITFERENNLVNYQSLLTVDERKPGKGPIYLAAAYHEDTLEFVYHRPVYWRAYMSAFSNKEDALKVLGKLMRQAENKERYVLCYLEIPYEDIDKHLSPYAKNNPDFRQYFRDNVFIDGVDSDTLDFTPSSWTTVTDHDKIIR